MPYSYKLNVFLTQTGVQLGIYLGIYDAPPAWAVCWHGGHCQLREGQKNR